VLRGR